MIFFRSLVTGSVLLFTVPVLFFSSPQPANTAPVVQIVSPVAGMAFRPATLVTYSVKVSDKEDGESAFEEIPATEIFMELRYFTDPVKASAFPKAKDPAGYLLFKKGDCFNCHAVRSKLIGPSFADLSARYKKPEDIITMAAHIRKGSTGIWGTAVMPTHPDLAEKDAQQIVRWILGVGGDGNADYFRGAEGAFHLPGPAKPSPRGFYLLKATYADHGTDKAGAGSLTGQDIKRLKTGN